jgi:hypothetical protein
VGPVVLFLAEGGTPPAQLVSPKSDGTFYKVALPETNPTFTGNYVFSGWDYAASGSAISGIVHEGDVISGSSSASTGTILIVTAKKRLSAAATDKSLSSLVVKYSDGGYDNLISFDSSTTKYTINAISGKTSVKVNAVKATSQGNVKIMVGASQKANDADIDFGTSSITINVLVTAGDNGTQTYEIIVHSFLVQKTTYSGTVSSNYNTYSLNSVIIRNSAGGVLSTSNINTSTGNSWSAEIPNSATVASFVVALTDTDSKPYRSKSIARVGTATTNITLTLDSTQRDAGFAVTGPDELALMSSAAGKTLDYVLDNNIDLGTYNWTPPTGFSGHFSGNGYTIKNLVLKKTSGNTGLFSTILVGAVIENFTLEVSTDPTAVGGIAMTGASLFGGLVGEIYSGVGEIRIRNITVKGELHYASSSATFNTGGLIGDVNSANTSTLIIENCVSAIDITANNVARNGGIGGFIGTAESAFAGSIQIKNCYSTGNITVTGSGSGMWIRAGGIVGLTQDNNTHIAIENCYASGSISVISSSGNSSLWVGGLVGSVRNATYKSVTNSAALNPSLTCITGITALLIGRVTGTEKDAATLTNNAARSTMGITITTGSTYTVNDDDGDKDGGSVAVPDDSDDIITVLNTIESGTQDVWDWDTTTNLPRLK